VGFQCNHLQVVELVSEPKCIALAHGLNRFKGEKTVLICDFGIICCVGHALSCSFWYPLACSRPAGSTSWFSFLPSPSPLPSYIGQHAFRASLIDISGSKLTVAQHHLEEACGGEKIEELLFSYCLAEFKRQQPAVKINVANDVHQALYPSSTFVHS
jgi:hypothetical protein